MEKVFEARDYEKIFTSFYRKGLSLREDVERLADPQQEISFDYLVSIILKYWYSFQYGKSPDEAPDLMVLCKDFEMFFYDSFFKDSTKRNYSARMLADVPSSCSIFQEIISQKINLDSVGKAYGVDSGSGTGILLLAQHILACRNGIRGKVDLVGIEINEPVALRAQDLVLDLFGGEIDLKDATKAETFRRFEEEEIFCITNENIPDEGQLLTSEPVYLKTLEYLPKESLYTFPENPLITNIGSKNAEFWAIDIAGKNQGLPIIGSDSRSVFSRIAGVPESEIREMFPKRWRSMDEGYADYERLKN